MSTACSAFLVTSVIVVAGLLGGAINHLQSNGDDQTAKSKTYYFFLSIAAAAIVPLFLSLTKSQVLANVLSTPVKLEDWFVFFAACVLAAVYAKNFLETVSKKFLQTAEEAKEAAKKAKMDAGEAKRDAAEAIKTADKNEQAGEKVENPASATRSVAAQQAKIANVDLSTFEPDEGKILTALLNPRFDRRSLGGIAGESKIPRTALRPILEKLVKNGFVHEVVGEKTSITYYQINIDQISKPARESAS